MRTGVHSDANRLRTAGPVPHKGAQRRISAGQVRRNPDASGPQGQTQRQLVKDLLNRAFGGSAKQMVMQALTDEEASEEELTRIEEFLDKLEEEKT